MECIKCGKYYPDAKKVCPDCGYAMTKEERKAYKADLKLRIKERERLDREKRKQPKTPEELEHERRYRELCKQYEQERKDAKNAAQRPVSAASNVGCLYVLAFPLAILTLPFRLAADMMGGKKRRR